MRLKSPPIASDWCKTFRFDTSACPGASHSIAEPRKETSSCTR